MARPTYTDLILVYTPSSGSEGGNTTSINNIIILLMKETFRIFAKGEYDTYSVSVDHPTIDTTDVYSVIIRRASQLGNEFIMHTMDKTKPVPDFKLTSEDIVDLSQSIGQSLISKEFVQRQEDNELGIQDEVIYY